MTDRIYVSELYWAENYVGYQADASVGMDNYIDENYYDDNSYYEFRGAVGTLTADVTVIRMVQAEATANANATLTGLVGVVKQFASAISAQATTTCVISHIEGADLSAFTNASVLADANRLRESTASISATASTSATSLRIQELDVSISSQATAAISAVLTADRSASINEEFAQATSADRFRLTAAQLDAQATFTAETLIIGPTGTTVEATGTWTTAFTQSQTVELYKEYSADLSVTASIDESVNRIRETTGALETQVTQTSVSGRIVQGACDFASLFSPSASIDGVKNTFAVLDSTSALATVAIANRSADIALSSIVIQSLQGDRIRDYAAELNTTSTLDVAYVNTVPVQATLSSTTTLTADNLRVRYASATIAGAFTPAITVRETSGLTASLTSTFTQTATVKRIRSGSATINALASTLVVGEQIQSNDFFINGLYSTGLDFIGSSTAKDTVGNVYLLMKAGSNAVIAKFNPRGKLLSQTELDTPTLLTNSKLQIVGDDLYGLVNYNETEASRVTTASLTIVKAKLFKFNTLNNTVTWTRTTGELFDATDSTGHYFSGTGVCVYTGAKSEAFYSLTDFDIYNNNIYLVGYNRFRYFDSVDGLTYDAYRRVQANVSLTGTVTWAKVYDWRSQNASCPPRVANDVIETLPSDFNLKIEASSLGLYIAGPFIGSNNFQHTRSYSLQTNLSGVTQYQYQVVATPVDTTFNDTVVDSNGNVIICATGTTTNTMYITSIGASGKNWGLLIENDTTNRKNICVDSSNNVYVNYRDYVIKISSTGSVVWSRRFYTSTGTLTINRLEVFDGYLNVSSSWNNGGVNQAVILQTLADGSDESITRTSSTGVDYIWTSSSVTTSDNSLSVSKNSISDTNGGNVFVTSIDAGLFQDNGTLLDTNLTPTVSTYTANNIIVRVVSAPISTSAEFTQTAVNTRRRGTTAQLTSAFTDTTNAVKKASGRSTLTAQATLVPNGGYIKGITKTLTVVATVTNQPLRIKQLEATLSTAFTTTANAKRIRGYTTPELAAQFAATIDVERTRPFTATLAAMAYELSAVTKIGVGIVHFDAVASQSTTAVKTARTGVVVNAQTTQTTQAVKTASAQSTLQEQFNISTTGDKIRGNNAEISTEFTASINTVNSRIRPAQVNSAITASTQVVAVKTTDITSQMPLVTTVVFGDDVRRVRLADSQQTVIASQQTNAVKTVNPPLVFDAIATEMVIGNIIAFDQELMLHIPYEYRTLQIPEENTLLWVPVETRVNMVRKIAQ